MDDNYIISLTPDTIFRLRVLDDIFDIEDPIERAQKLALYRQKAKEYKMLEIAESYIKSYESMDKELEKDFKRNSAYNSSVIELERDGNGKALSTIMNFIKVIENDSMMKRMKLRYNLLTNTPEKVIDGVAERWSDFDDTLVRLLVESRYHFHSVQKCDDALNHIFTKNAYHPIKDIIGQLEWDGQSRIYDFLHTWMKCEDTEYTREVSRLIFAGGINRLYHPGCKFDDMPVLIGTKQGEGKSTIVRWLALNDSYFTEITNIEGKEGMENINGAWICEMGELLALTKAKEVEAIKSFLTRQSDKYREAYGKRTSEHLRQCIFIGTTNKEQFLTDKTGNRRFYPVKVNQSGYELFRREQECKEYIRQCWAEAKVLFDKGELQPFANPELIDIIREKQAEAVEDDYRIGMIEKYLENKEIVCRKEIWRYALGIEYKEMSRKDSMEIGMILSGIDGWNKVGLRHTADYGRQWCWVKEKQENDDDFDEIIV